MEEVVGSIPTRSTNYYQVTQRNETASARFSTLMGLPRRAGSVHEKAIFHQLTRMWTTHGVGNSQSMGASAFLGTNQRRTDESPHLRKGVVGAQAQTLISTIWPCSRQLSVESPTSGMLV